MTDLLGAASLVVSQTALEALTARTAKPRAARRRGLMEHTQVIIRPVVSEKSYVLSAADRYTFRVHPDAHKTQIRQAVRGAVRRARGGACGRSSVKPKPKRRGNTARGARAHGRRRSCRCAPGESIPIFQGLAALEG